MGLPKIGNSWILAEILELSFGQGHSALDSYLTGEILSESDH